MDNKTDSLTRYYSKKKKRKERRKFAFYTVLTVLFIVATTILSLTVFFNISDIAVTANEHYTDAEIIAASGLTEGQNLFRLNKFKLIEKLKEKLPYLADVSVDRHLPVGIEIIVTEAKPYLTAGSGEEYYILDETLRVLEITDTQPENLPLVTGLSPSSAVLGDVITAENGEDTRLSALTAALKTHIGDDCVTAIDVTTSFDVTFEYQGRIKVLVGTVDGIDNKLQLVKYVIDENRSNEKAEIDISSGTRAYYRSVDNRPEKEQEKDTDTEEKTDEKTEQNDDEKSDNEKE